MKIKSLLIALLLFVSVTTFAQDFKIKYGPYIQNMGENEATIVWVTSKDALSWVETAPDDGTHFYAQERPQFFETSNGRKLVGTLHKVTIKGLNKGTKYRYRIYSREVLDNAGWDTKFGKIAASNPNRVFSFTTLDAGKDGTSFAVVNDIHANNELLESLLKNVKTSELDFIVFNGDMMSHLNSEEAMFNGFLNKSTELFASNLPFFLTRGNHETRGPFSTRYMDYFPTPTGKPYYYFKQGGVFFLMLDSGEDKPDTDIEYGGLSAFDDYRKDELEWVKKVVESDEYKNAPVKIVFIHVPAFTSTWHGTLHVQELFIPVLNNTRVNLMLCGHTHRYSFIPKGEKENDFPILVNSNKEMLDINVKDKKIDVKIIDTEGKVSKTFNF